MKDYPNHLSSLTHRAYSEQVAEWPVSGRHIMAQFDDDSIIVYQAYRESIGRYAVEHQVFGGDFSYSRMSWIKPNFLWMMFRSGWASKEGQEVVLAIRIQREAFDRFLVEAVHSTYVREIYGSNEDWKERVSDSDVRLQWDPDHGPKGHPLERRAIQLGLRGEALRCYGREAIVEIEDVSEFVREQAAHVDSGQLDQLTVPFESPYPAPNPSVTAHLGLDAFPPETQT